MRRGLPRCAPDFNETPQPLHDDPAALEAGGVPVTAVLAHHVSHAGAQTPDAVGFIFELDGIRVYHTGDTLYHPDLRQVRDLRPDFAALMTCEELSAYRGVMVTAAGEPPYDFVSRFFAPKAGVPEDPATGSSHCTLTPYWSRRLGKTSLTARQLSSRGAEMRCEQRGDRVVISGHCAWYLKGEITV